MNETLSGPTPAASSRRRSLSLACGEPALSESQALARESRTGISRGGEPRTGEASSTVIRWLKFNLVGAIGIGVQFATLFLLKSVLDFDYLFATAFAVEAAVVHNFVWHEQFTWVDRIKPDRIKLDRIKLPVLEPCWRQSLQRFLRFNLTAGAVSLVGNLALMKVMVGQGHMNYLLANAIAITLCSIANFLVSDQWVFER